MEASVDSHSVLYPFIYLHLSSCMLVNKLKIMSVEWTRICCFVVRCCFIIILCVFVKRLNSSSLTVDYSKLLPSQTLFIEYSYAGNSFRLGRNKILFIKQVYSPFWCYLLKTYPVAIIIKRQGCNFSGSVLIFVFLHGHVYSHSAMWYICEMPCIPSSCQGEIYFY